MGEEYGFSSGDNEVVRNTSKNVPANDRAPKSEKRLESTKVIAGAVGGIFETRIEDIENFYHLICQRVRDQSECDSESAEVVVYLSDGTSRRMNTISEFKSYAEMGVAVPTVVNLGIALDVKFPGSSQSEKQHVNISIRASDITSEMLETQVAEDRIRFASDKMQISILAAESDLGIISYMIDHSRISWGLDIENLIQAHISKLLQPPTFFEKSIKWLRSPLHITTTILVGLVASNQAIDILFKFLFATENVAVGTTLVDVASNWLTNGHIAKYIVMSLVIAVVIVTLVSTFVRSALKNLQKPRPSFILLSKHDENRRTERLKRHHRRWTRIAAILLLNIAVIVATFALEDRVQYYWNNIFLEDFSR